MEVKGSPRCCRHAVAHDLTTCDGSVMDLANDKRTVKADPSMTDRLDFQRLEHELLLTHSASRTGKGSLPSGIFSSKLFPNAH